MNSDDASGKHSMKTKKTLKSTASDVSSCHSKGSASATKKTKKKKAPARSKSSEALKSPKTPSSTAGSNHSRNSLPPIKRKAPARSKSADMIKSPNSATHSAKSPRTPGNGTDASTSNHSRLSLPQTIRKTPQRSRSDDLTLMSKAINRTPRTPGGNSNSNSSRSSHSSSTFVRRTPPRSRSSDFVRQQQQQQQIHIVSKQFANHKNNISNSLNSQSEHLEGLRGRSRSRSPSRPGSRPNLNTASYHPPARPVLGRSLSCERVGPTSGGGFSRDRSLERRPQSGTGLGGAGVRQSMVQRKSFSDLNEVQMMRRSLMDRSGHSTRSGGLPPQRGRSIERGGSSHVPRGPSMDRNIGPPPRGAPPIRGRSRSIERRPSMEGPPIRGRSRSIERPPSLAGPPIRGRSRSIERRPSMEGPPIRGRSRSIERRPSMGGPPIRGRSRSIERRPSMGGPPIRGRSMERRPSLDGPAIRGRSRSMDRSVDRARSRSRDRSYDASCGRLSVEDLMDKGTIFGRLDREHFPWKKVLSYIIPICVLIGCAVGLITVTGNASKFVPPAFKDQRVTNEDLSDPFAGNNGVPTWESNGNGQQLTVINALTNEWRTAFTLATADWDYGVPDAVDLLIEEGTPEYKCEQVPRKIKACNGDYGDSKWRGICEVTTDGNGLLSSASVRMNDFYLSVMEDGAWQYTMCHELGKICRTNNPFGLFLHLGHVAHTFFGFQWIFVEIQDMR